jgi:hypothetical protein
MTKTSDVRDFFQEGRPLVEQDLDIAEQFKAMRDAARAKGVDWSQVKALLKAQILDEREGTDKRVRAIVEKADCASAYADMLGLSEKSFSREIAHIPPLVRETAETTEVGSAEEKCASEAASAAGPLSIPADLSIPPYLRRQPAEAV